MENTSRGKQSGPAEQLPSVIRPSGSFYLVPPSSLARGFTAEPKEATRVLVIIFTSQLAGRKEGRSTAKTHTNLLIVSFWLSTW